MQPPIIQIVRLDKILLHIENPNNGLKRVRVKVFEGITDIKY